MEHNNWESSWRSMFDDLERLHPNELIGMVDWYPSGQMEITIKFDDGRRKVYDWYNNQIFEIVLSNNDDVDDEQWKKDFARRLHRKLYACAMTQDQLAQATGISFVTINKYVKGNAVPSLSNAVKIARALRCSVTEFVEDCRF